MALKQIPMSTVVLVALMTLHATAHEAITLDVSVHDDASARSGLQVINCSLESTGTKLKTVTSLGLFGLKPYGAKEEYDQLAVVDIWTNSPRLSSELQCLNVTVRGQIGSPSTLDLSWSYQADLHRHSYRCVAYGLDEAAQPQAVSTTFRPDMVPDSLRLELHTLSAHVESLVANASEEVDQKVRALHQKVDGLESKIDAIYLSARVHSTLLAAIYTTNFDVSDVFKDRVYLASKQEAVFDMETSDRACVAAGGYLVEIDDNQENKFVLDFATRIGGSDVFMTGGNDLDQEGRFVYFHNKKPVPDHVTWISGQPSNYGGREHCMHFWISEKGLNDTHCDNKAKYVCEVPLRPH